MRTVAWTQLPPSVLVALVLACGSQGKSSSADKTAATTATPQPPVAQPPTAVAAPDLAVSLIEIIPEQPRASTAFTLNVDVTNRGTAASTEYDLEIYRRPAGAPGGTYYDVEWVHKRGLQPGETVRVYSSGDRAVNDPGRYEVVVLLRTADGKEISRVWPFNSLPRS